MTFTEKSGSKGIIIPNPKRSINITKKITVKLLLREFINLQIFREQSLLKKN